MTWSALHSSQSSIDLFFFRLPYAIRFLHISQISARIVRVKRPPLALVAFSIRFPLLSLLHSVVHSFEIPGKSVYIFRSLSVYPIASLMTSMQILSAAHLRRSSSRRSSSRMSISLGTLQASSQVGDKGSQESNPKPQTIFCSRLPPRHPTRASDPKPQNDFQLSRARLPQKASDTRLRP
jgi:hypothetical protein